MLESASVKIVVEDETEAAKDERGLNVINWRWHKFEDEEDNENEESLVNWDEHFETNVSAIVVVVIMKWIKETKNVHI